MVRAGARLSSVIVIVLAVVSCNQQSSQQGVVPQTAKDTLVIAESAIPTSFDSDFIGNSSGSLEATENFTDPLVSFKTQTNANGTLSTDYASQVPFLAQSYMPSADGLTWNFILRQGVKSPNGNELTSADVQYMIARSYALNGGACAGFELGVSQVDKNNPITVSDKYSFAIHLTSPSPLLPVAFGALPSCSIFDSTEMKKNATASDPWSRAWAATNTAGFGPYTVASNLPGQETDWVANPNYWQGPPKFKKIVIKNVPDPSTRLALLERGAVDIAEDLTTRQYSEAAGKNGLAVDNQSGNQGLILGWNNAVPPLDNATFRQALNYALPTNAIISSVFLGAAGVKVASGYIPAGYPGQLDAWPYPQNDAKAKALLAQSGVNLSTPIQLSYSTDQSADQQVATLIKSHLAQLGVTIELNGLSTAAYAQEFYSRKAQAILVHDAPWVVDGPYVLDLYFSPIGTGNWVNFKNSAVTSILNQATAAQSPDVRASLTKQADQLIVNEAPWGFYLQVGNQLAHLQDVKGYVWRSTSLLRYGDIYKT